MATVRITAKVVGLGNAKRQLRSLPKAIRNRAMRRGFSRIGGLLAKDVKSQVPGKGGKDSRRTGATKRSIGFRIKLYRTSGSIMLAVGPRSGFAVIRFGSASVRLKSDLETASKQIRIGLTGARGAGGHLHRPGQVFHFTDTPRGYLINAFNRNKSRLPAIMQEEVRRALDTYASPNG